jgi:thiamine-phosphate diphosphorylase
VIVSAELPRLHVITDDELLAAAGFMDRARALLHVFGSSIALHLRGRRAGGRLLFELASRLSAVSDSIVLVNDRVDVALTTALHGVQLRRDSLPVRDARNLLGPERRIGYSAHALGEAGLAVSSGADFVIAGTIFRSDTHAGAEPAGVALIEEIARAVDVPVLAIGGVNASRGAECRLAGAHGVAVIRAVWSAPDAVGAVRHLLSELEA